MRKAEIRNDKKVNRSLGLLLAALLSLLLFAVFFYAINIGFVEALPSMYVPFIMVSLSDGYSDIPHIVFSIWLIFTSLFGILAFVLAIVKKNQKELKSLSIILSLFIILFYVPLFATFYQCLPAYVDLFTSSLKGTGFDGQSLLVLVCLCFTAILSLLSFAFFLSSYFVALSGQKIDKYALEDQEKAGLINLLEEGLNTPFPDFKPVKPETYVFLIKVPVIKKKPESRLDKLRKAFYKPKDKDNKQETLDALLSHAPYRISYKGEEIPSLPNNSSVKVEEAK